MNDADAELRDIAGGDPQRAELLRRSLERLQNGAAGPALQEMARDVLAGRIGLRDATGYAYYQEALTAEATRYQQWRDQAGEAEVADAVRRARQTLGGPL